MQQTIETAENLSLLGIDAAIHTNGAKIETYGKTGAEIEAIHGVSTGLITIYDMCKSVDRSMIINKIKFDFKDGGKSGKWER